ncbi:MAG: dehydratase, partial [Anaerolineales bacterium]
RTGVLEGTVLAFREINEWKFMRPIFIGDTIHVELEVMETKFMPRLNAGTITILVKVLNHNDELVMKGNWVALIASQTTSS